MRTARGFTLIELMVTMLIASVAVAAVSTVFLTQVQMYQRHEGRRSSQASARTSLTFLEERVRRAGYGVDPALAFIPFDSYNAAGDAAGVNFPDAVAVHSRDPRFTARTLTAADDDSLDFTPALTEALEPGQILLAVCSGGESHAYSVVSARALAGATTVSLRNAAVAESPRGAPGPRFHQQAQLNDGCYDDGTATLIKVERSSFYVAAFDDDRDAATPPVPYLMLHRGLDSNGDGSFNADDSVPLAQGVEQLQLAYILNSNDDAPPTIVGVTDAPGYGDAWAASATGPEMEDFYSDASRLVNHPANIRQVRITLVVRGAVREQERVGDNAITGESGAALAGGAIPWKALENLGTPVTTPAFSPQAGGYARTVLRVSVAPKNLLMKNQFQSPAVGGG